MAQSDVTSPSRSTTAAFLPSPSEAVSSSSWALYLLLPVSTAALGDELVRGAATHQDSDASVPYLLLLEAYLLVQTKLLALREHDAAAARLDPVQEMAISLEIANLQRLRRTITGELAGAHGGPQPQIRDRTPSHHAHRRPADPPSPHFSSLRR